MCAPKIFLKLCLLRRLPFTLKGSPAFNVIISCFFLSLSQTPSQEKHQTGFYRRGKTTRPLDPLLYPRVASNLIRTIEPLPCTCTKTGKTILPPSFFFPLCPPFNVVNIESVIPFTSSKRRRCDFFIVQVSLGISLLSSSSPDPA